MIESKNNINSGNHNQNNNNEEKEIKLKFKNHISFDKIFKKLIEIDSNFILNFYFE
jgi:hypothetical protein